MMDSVNQIRINLSFLNDFFVKLLSRNFSRLLRVWLTEYYQLIKDFIMEFPYPKLKATFLVESCRFFLDVKLNVAGYKKNTNDLIQNYYVNLKDDLNSNTIQIGNIEHLTENSLRIWWRQDCPNISAHSGLKTEK